MRRLQKIAMRDSLLARYTETLGELMMRRYSEEAMRAGKAESDLANRSKSAFLATMSHELRTPLNAIIGYSELMREEAEDLELKSFIRDLSKIESAGKHLLALINGVLDIAKIEAGKMDLHAETFEVARMIEEVSATVAPVVKKNGNYFEIAAAPNLGTMHTDLTKVRQSLFNLLGNAGKFTKEGKVRLEVERVTDSGRDWLVFHVRDTGVGMTAEQTQKVFDAFTQADASTTRKYGGTGLGLAITREFSRLIGGDVMVKSALGQGSVFTLRVPAELSAGGAEDVKAPSDALNAPPEVTDFVAGQPQVLLIDDDPTVHDLVRRFLQKEGIHVIGAQNGPEGLELAHKIRPAMIVLDVMMPTMDGWSVLTRLKGDPELSDIPVVMLTMVNNREMGFSLGVDDYMLKPIDRSDFVATLRKYCNRQDKPTVLVVEDDDVTRDMLRASLEKEEFIVAEASNGVEALQKLATLRPALILLDLMMPEMDGFQFTREVRAHAEWHDIPILVMTAKDIAAEDRALLDGQVSRILQKGACAREELLAEISHRVARCARTVEGAAA
ncbi:MAG: response regulator [Chthoniobacter sp.]|nr:response regulator [Chthoniobacter sp.]